MDVDIVYGKIFYYCREKCYGKMQEVIKENLSKTANNSVLLMYNGFALILSGRYPESIRELNAFQSHTDIGLCAVMCLIYSHKRCISVDREVLQQLEARLKEERRRTSAISLYYSALFLFFSNKLDKASDIVDKSIKMDGKYTQASTLKGWIEMYRNPNNLTQKISDYFEPAVGNIDFDGIIGLATFKYLNKENAVAITLLERLIMNYPFLDIPLLEKLKNEIALYNWEQGNEIVEQILLKEDENIQALKYKIFLLLCKKGDYIEAAGLMDKYYSYLEKYEPKNSDLFYNLSKLYSRICGRSNTILTQTYRFAKYAAELHPANIDYLTELGHQCFMQGKPKDAQHFFKSATKVDDNSINALCGLTLCQMAENGPSEQIEQQIELLNELIGSNTRHPLLLLMSSKLEHKYPEKAVSILNDLSNILFNKSNHLPFGIEYILMLDPDIVMETIHEYLKYTPKKPMVIIDSIIFNFEEHLPTAVAHTLSMLENLTKCCPGLVPAVYCLAKTQFIYGKTNLALQNAQDLVENIDQTFANGHLLLAQIYIQQNLYNRAEQCLEVCLSYNFKVRDNPMYHMLQGIVFKHKNKLNDALVCFTSSMNLLGNKFQNKQKGEDNDLTLPDKATLYLELINMHSALGQHTEATKIMQEAIEEFSYTTEEVRLTIISAELALQKNDIDHAIELLSQITSGQPYYLQAHTKLAHIYLKEKDDRLMFAKCFEEVVANHPGSDGQSMLGDAYMSIHEPSHAIEAFTKALEQNPKDLNLIKKLGLAYIKMHLYSKAEKTYVAAIESLNNSELKLDLIDLYIKLKKYDMAEEVIKTELDKSNANNATDFVSMKFQTKFLMMLAKVKERIGGDVGRRGTLNALKEARENQSRLVKRAHLDSRSDLNEEKKILSEICTSLAAQFMTGKAVDQAIQTYKEALQFNPQHPPILLALSKLYMQVNEADLCQQTCSILLNADPENEAASVMMADLAFRKVDFETASFHLKQLLTAQPTYWTALERLIEVQRRLGNLEEAAPFLNKFQDSEHSEEPGYLYCAGLYARFNGDPNVALKHWGRARRAEGQWGRNAAVGVIKVCLSPGGEALPPPLQDDTASDTPDDIEYRDTRSFALGMAERLLSELQNGTGYDAAEIMELRLLGFRLTLASRKKGAIEVALRTLLQMASEEGGIDDIGIAVAIACTYIVLKQAQRARNQLKRFARVPWTPEKAEWLETCWVLLADCLITAGNSSSNIEAAKDSIDRALKHNKSCTQAYEYLGYLCEKEQTYKQAALHYENAWKYGGQGNASMGYKYALCLFKAKKYAEAILVSRDVLIAHPNCPKIRKEVMDKASGLLRM